MRREPQARGRCHDANYVRDTKFPTILVPDVCGTDAIAVPDEAAALVGATEHAPPWRTLAPVPALGARPGGVRLFLQDDLHPEVLCLVGELLPHPACRPLVNLLVIRVTNIRILSKIAHVANHERQARLPAAAW
jgi:hypothetical protein